jgi:CBS domain containing-hemolysin-like protein
MTAQDAWAFAAIALCLVAAAYLGAAQTALARMTVNRADKLVEEGRRGATKVRELMLDPARTLNILALLVLSVQVTGVVLLMMVLVRYLSDGWAAVIAAAAGSVALFVAAEVAPKTLAVQHTDEVARLTAPWVLRLARPLSPLATLFIRLGNVIAPGKGLPRGPFVTEDDLREMIDVAESDEVIEEAERAMIHSIFELGETVVREIMVPRPDMVTVTVADDFDRVVEVILTHGHSRIPVYAEDRDKIVGLIYAKDMLRRMHLSHGNGNGDWQDMLRPPYFVPELKQVDDLLRELQAEKVHLAIVVDEYGATAGLVTIEDILEEIVGEIVDEYDTEETLVSQLTDGGWRVDARVPVDELGELLSCELPNEEWDTVGGLLFGLLGHVPAPGEYIEVAGLRFTAEEVAERRISTVTVEHVEDPGGEAALPAAHEQ